VKQLPKRIILCGHLYEIQLLDMSDSDYNGRIFYSDKTIKIEEKLSLLWQWEILGHEIVHAFLERAGLGGERVPVSLNSEQLGSLLGYQLGELLSRDALEAPP